MDSRFRGNDEGQAGMTKDSGNDEGQAGMTTPLRENDGSINSIT